MYARSNALAGICMYTNKDSWAMYINEKLLDIIMITINRFKVLQKTFDNV